VVQGHGCELRLLLVPEYYSVRILCIRLESSLGAIAGNILNASGCECSNCALSVFRVVGFWGLLCRFMKPRESVSRRTWN